MAEMSAGAGMGAGAIPAIIVDIDGTLSDPSHRLHFLARRPPDWEGFFRAMGEDEPRREIIALVEDLWKGSSREVLLVSGRPEGYREVTMMWLSRHKVPHSLLYMRPEGDHRPDWVVKEEILDKIIAGGFDPRVVLDDRPEVLAMWRRRGLETLRVGDWDGRAGAAAKPLRSPTLTLMVGPTGAGKTHFLRNPNNGAFKTDSILSSDAMRYELCGDFRDQSRNEEVFGAMKAIARARLEHGLDVVVDATNIRRKDRLGWLDLAPEGTKLRYIVIDRPLAEKRRDGGWRLGLERDGQPFDLIGKHDQTFRSQIKDILRGDGRGVEVLDLRAEAKP